MVGEQTITEKGDNMKTKELVRDAFLAAILLVLQVSLSWLPNVELVSLLLILYSVSYTHLLHRHHVRRETRRRHRGYHLPRRQYLLGTAHHRPAKTSRGILLEPARRYGERERKYSGTCERLERSGLPFGHDWSEDVYKRQCVDSATVPDPPLSGPFLPPQAVRLIAVRTSAVTNTDFLINFSFICSTYADSL